MAARRRGIEATAAAAAVLACAQPVRTALSTHDHTVLTDLFRETGGEAGWWTICGVGWGQGDPCDPATPWGARQSGGPCVECNGAGNAVSVLNLGSSNLTGRLPASIGGLASLQSLDLGNNSLIGPLPASLGGLTALQTLIMSSNGFTSGLPAAVGALTSLKVLDVADNALTGTLPSNLTSLSRLQAVDLSGNGLSGELPTDLGARWPQLTRLSLHSNHFSGAIPASIGDCSNLTDLLLGGNSLHGGIPAALTRLARLETLAVDGNQDLGGRLPQTIGQMSALRNLTMSHTRITGTLPAGLCNLTQLVGFFAGFSHLYGELPPCIGQLTALEYLDLRGVSLTGRIPSGFLELRRLYVCLISGGDFQGTGLPLERPATTEAACADVSPQCPHWARNGCCGGGRNTSVCPLNATAMEAQCGPSCNYCIEGYTGPLPFLHTFALIGARLGGNIPGWMGALPRINTLEFSGNALTGPLPTFRPNSTLTQFSAANNFLSGTLEPLRHATRLTLLDLSHNSIGGTVQAWVFHDGNTALALKTNDLSGDLHVAGDDEDSTPTNILSGNVFSCPVPEGIEERDKFADAYVCGSEDFDFAGYFFVAAAGLSVVALAGVYLHGARSRSTKPVNPYKIVESPAPTANAGHASVTSPLEGVLAMGLLGVTTAANAVLLPVYITAPSVLTHQYAWITTVAYLHPAGVSTSGWPYGIAIVGGVGLAGGVACWVLAVGARRQVVGLVAPSLQWVLRWQAVLSWIVYLVLVGMCVGLNIGFLLAEESSETSGLIKHFIVVIFAVMHEVIDNVLVPLFVSALAVTAEGNLRRPSTTNRRSSSESTSRDGISAGVTPSVVFTSTIALELVNSVLAPVIAQLLYSEGCFRDKLFGTDEVPSAVSVGYCQQTAASFPLAHFSNASQCNAAEGSKWVTYQVAGYTPTFHFDGNRCLSSIITLYTPEYLVIFALRLLLYPLAWWLAHTGRPWVLAGVRPPVQLRRSFLAARRKVVSALSGCRHFPPDSVHSLDPTEAEAVPGSDEARGAVYAAADTGNNQPTSGAMFFHRNHRVKKPDRVLTILHAIEPGVNTFNLLAIAVCVGMLAPVVAAAAALSYLLKLGWVLVLDGHPEGENEHGSDEAEVHEEHPMPVLCVLQLLAVQTLYVVVVLLITQNVVTVGVVVSGVSWLAVAAVWSHARFNAKAAPAPVDSPPASTLPTTVTANAAFELREKLLPPAGYSDSQPT